MKFKILREESPSSTAHSDLCFRIYIKPQILVIARATERRARRTLVNRTMHAADRSSADAPRQIANRPHLLQRGRGGSR
jgi:hypothetical protein